MLNSRSTTYIHNTPETDGAVNPPPTNHAAVCTTRTRGELNCAEPGARAPFHANPAKRGEPAGPFLHPHVGMLQGITLTAAYECESVRARISTPSRDHPPPKLSQPWPCLSPPPSLKSARQGSRSVDDISSVPAERPSCSFLILRDERMAGSSRVFLRTGSAYTHTHTPHSIHTISIRTYRHAALHRTTIAGAWDGPPTIDGPTTPHIAKTARGPGPTARRGPWLTAPFPIQTGVLV